MIIPQILFDPRTQYIIDEDLKLANEFADIGTVKHFVLKLGYCPNNEKHAEDILNRIILEHEYLLNIFNIR